MAATVTPDVQDVLPRRIFDEESCRYFLREVGEQVVPFYPFSFGIHEVYDILLERYGPVGIADALSILHDLLEGDDNATGLGDDGDIWRSWRHNWKHRNDDPLNPAIPQVGNFILPPPSSKASRSHRTVDLSTRPKEQISSSKNGRIDTPLADPSDHSGAYQATNAEEHVDRSRLILTPERWSTVNKANPQNEHILQTRSFLHSRSASNESGTLSSSEPLDTDSQQDFREVDPSLTPEGTDPASLISFEILRPTRSGRPQADLHGGSREDCTLQPISTPYSQKDRAGRREVKRAQIKGQQNSLDEMVGNWGLETFGSRDNLALDFDIYCRPDASQIRARPPDTSCSEESRSTGGLNMRKPHGVRGTSTGSRVMSCDLSPAGNARPHRRAANRDARLIDGAIFTSKARRTFDHAKRSTTESVEDVISSKRSSLRASWADIRQKGVRSLFRRAPQRKHRQETDRSSPTNGNNTNSVTKADMSQRRGGAVDDTSLASTTHAPGRTAFGLDGARDDPRQQSPVNLNKALPLHPDLIPNRTPSLSQGTTRPSTASISSSGISESSSKAAFREVARGLINTDLAPLHETPVMVDPANFDPCRSPNSANSHLTFSSVANRNPFIDNTQPMSPIMPAPLSIPKREDSYAYRINGLSHLPKSPSAPSFPPYSPRQIGRAEQHAPQYSPTSPARVTNSREDSTGDEDRRGRVARRPSSADHPAFRMQDHPAPKSEKTSKRSRSPVKKLLGFGKSTSLKDIAGEHHTQPAPKSPSKMTSLKSWGHRVRHGFMVVDEELEAQTRPAVKPPPVIPSSPPQQSTFSVGLEPPYQAKVLMEIELMICVTANRFLLSEYKHGRLSPESVAAVKKSWADRNRPQVIEFHYDQTTQRELVLANLKTVQLHGEPGSNPIVLNATLYNWKVLAKDLSIRTFCSPDSAIRKHLHDAHKILEMLGAPVVTFLAFGDMQVKTLSKMTEKQRERAERRKHATTARRVDTPAPNASMSSTSRHYLFPPDDSPTKSSSEHSRRGQLGARVRDRV